MQDLQKSLPDIDGSIPVVSMALAGDRIVVQAMWQLGLDDLFKVRREYSHAGITDARFDIPKMFTELCIEKVKTR